MAYTAYTVTRRPKGNKLVELVMQPGVQLLIFLALASLMFGLADPEQFAALALLS